MAEDLRDLRRATRAHVRKELAHDLGRASTAQLRVPRRLVRSGPERHADRSAQQQGGAADHITIGHRQPDTGILAPVQVKGGFALAEARKPDEVTLIHRLPPGRTRRSRTNSTFSTSRGSVTTCRDSPYSTEGPRSARYQGNSSPSTVTAALGTCIGRTTTRTLRASLSTGSVLSLR